MKSHKNSDYIIKALFVTSHNSQNEKTNILTSCDYNYTPNLSIISYSDNETQKTDLENFETKIKIYSNKKIIINRLNKINNNLNNSLIIEKDTRNEFKYKTPFGVILMGTIGEFLDIKLSEDTADIFFSYKIDFNRSYSHSNQVKIKITKN